MSAREDALDGGRLEGAEASGMGECGVDVGGVVAGAQQEDLPSVMGPDPGGQGGELIEEGRGVLAHLLKRRSELVDVDGRLAVGSSVQAERVILLATTAGTKLVAREAGEVGPVDEELGLGDAQREEVGDVVVRDGVAIALPVDVAVDAAEAVGDTGRVVGVGRQRAQVRSFLAEPVERALPVTQARVDDAIHPVGELGAEVVAIAEGASVEERALVLPEAALGARLGIGATSYGSGADAVVCREGEVVRVVDGLLALPAQDDGLLAVVLAGRGVAVEACEGSPVPSIKANRSTELKASKNFLLEKTRT